MDQQWDAVCFGEILWDVLPSGAKPGGAPMNVAYHLQKQGLKVALISKVGHDSQGKDLCRVLEQAGLPTDYVQTDAEKSTGVVNATIQESNEVAYDIVHPVAWDFISLEEGMIELVQNATFFIYGSLSSRDSATAQTLWELLNVAQVKVLDINLRPPHFDQDRVERRLQSADILKMNEHELPLITSWYSGVTTDADQTRFLQDKFCIPTIIVTRGGDGAMVCKDGNFYSHPGFEVDVADTVGSGDAFLAGFLAKTKAGLPVEERLEFANALGAFIASREGACPAYERSELAAAKKEKLSLK